MSERSFEKILFLIFLISTSFYFYHFQKEIKREKSIENLKTYKIVNTICEEIIVPKFDKNRKRQEKPKTSYKIYYNNGTNESVTYEKYKSINPGDTIK